MSTTGADNPLELQGTETVLREVYNQLYGEYCKEIDLEKRMRLDIKIRKVDVLCRPSNPSFSTYSRLKDKCVEERFQFRRLNEFSGKIPSKVLVDVKNLEQNLNMQIGPFWIMADEQVFKKDNSRFEHALYAQIGYLEFFKISSWGSPSPNWRKYVYFPLRNTVTLISSIVVLALLTVLLFPISVYQGIAQNSIAYWSLHIWLLLVALATYSWLTLRIFRKTNLEQWKG